MTTTCVNRLRKELKKLENDKSSMEAFEAKPLANDIQTWHYIIKGPKDTPFEGGYYHGVLVFPKDYPYKPPSIQMLTPNGRFQTRTKLCLSNSDFHPESWSPFWSVSNILMGFISFMCEEGTAGVGSMNSTAEHKKCLALQSLEFNLQDKTFIKLFGKKYQAIYDQQIQTRKEQLSLLGQRNSNKAFKFSSSSSSLPSHGELLKKKESWWDWLIISIVVFCIGYVIRMIL
ncbi:hypothetical protein RFI_00256 [Reticulomyxa filosa]|uniref:UBC core domain-containing protein n=1 Tax=Reticulomyxa filosa TaxID=46433 RepID=X6PE70_RETFI|nr:hypothetical protein RFI_00256 [Reticulomyxa filosa]|eukprot:ETO36805.1 hypothetical protein RFI_00256 [Reticulomyxa filosa]